MAQTMPRPGCLCSRPLAFSRTPKALMPVLASGQLLPAQPGNGPSSSRNTATNAGRVFFGPLRTAAIGASNGEPAVVAEGLSPGFESERAIGSTVW